MTSDGAGVLREKRRSRCRCWCTGEAGEEVDAVEPLLGCGPERAHHAPLGLGSTPGAVAAPHLAVHDGRPDGLFGSPVGGVDARVGEEGEQRLPLGAQVGHQLAVLVVRVSVIGKQLHPFSEIGDRCRPFVVVEVPRTKCVGQQLAHSPRRAPRPGRQIGDELVAATEEVGETGLVRRLLEAPVGSPAVSDHDAGVLRRDHLARLLEAAAVRHPVASRSRCRRDPEPRTLPTAAPTRLVGHDHLRVVQRRDDRVLHRDERGRGRLGRLADRAGGDGDPEAGKQAGGLLEAQPEAVVQPGRPGLGDRPDLGGSSTESVGGLLGMPSLHSLATTPTAADVDVELRDDGADRGRVDLELLGGPLEIEITAAVGAARRQRCRELTVERSDRRHAVAVATVGVTPLPAGLGWLLDRVALGERSGLALARTTGLVKEALELGDALVALRKPSLALGQTRTQLPQLSGVGLEEPAQLGDLSDQLLVGVGIMARGSDARRNSQRYARPAFKWWTPLSKYLQRRRTSGSARVSSTMRRASSEPHSTRPRDATLPTNAPGSLSSTGHATRSTASRPRRRHERSTWRPSAISCTSWSTSGRLPGRSSPKAIPQPRPGWPTRRSACSAGRHRRSRRRSGARPPASAWNPTSGRTRTPAPTICWPRRTTSTTTGRSGKDGRSERGLSRAPFDTW